MRFFCCRHSSQSQQQSFGTSNVGDPKNRVGMARYFWCTKRGFTVFFSMLSLLVHYYSIYVKFADDSRCYKKSVKIGDKREAIRRNHLYNMDMRTSSGCPEQCWFQPIPHLHLPLESDIWMDCTHVQKHLIFLQLSVHLKPSWWIDMNSWPCLDLKHPVPPKSPDQFRQSPLCIWHRDVLMPWAKRRPLTPKPWALNPAIPPSLEHSSSFLEWPVFET